MQVHGGTLPEELFKASPLDEAAWLPLPCCLPLAAVLRCVLAVLLIDRILRDGQMLGGERVLLSLHICAANSCF